MKLILILIEIAVFCVLLVRLAKNYWADFVTREARVENLERALKLVPGNSEYHLHLARRFQYNVAELDPEKALTHLQRASELNPRDPRLWLELGAAHLLQGKTGEAQACLRRADSLAPNLPGFQWPIANFYLLQGDLQEAFRHFKMVLAGTSQYNQPIFDAAWKASGDNQQILEQVIPPRLSTEFDYLDYLTRTERYPEAHVVWDRIIAGSQGFPAERAGEYIDRLIQSRRGTEAHQVWLDLRSKGLVQNAAGSSGQENLLVNGDFEEEPLNMGFDWRIVPLENAAARLDRTTFHSPGRALLIQFSGKQNLDYQGVYQFVKVTPGRSYHLQAFLKTEGITADSGPRLMVRDAYDPRVLIRFSEDLTGTTLGWTLLTLDFSVGPQTELVVVGAARLPSQKLDNLIAGNVWLDDFSLTETGGPVKPPR